MKARHLLIAAVLAVAGALQASGATPAKQPADKPAKQPADRTAKPPAADKAAAKAPSADLSALAEAIEQATEPLAAVDAYSRGYAVDPNSLVLHQAYLKRMLKADLPEMAYDSARVVATAKPDDALAWSVLAHKHLQRGRLSQALSAVVRAEKGFGTHPFATKMAAVALGRYDAASDKPELPESLRQSIERIRPVLVKDKLFAAAYAKSRGAAAGKASRTPPPLRPDGKKPAPAAAPEAKPTAEELLARSEPLHLANRLAALSERLGHQASSLRSSIRGTGGSLYRSSTPGRSGYYLYASYGRLGTVGMTYSQLGYLSYGSGGSSVRRSFGYGSPRYSRYPRHHHSYRVYGSVTRGRRLRGMFGSTTHGRPSRGTGGVGFRRWGR